MFFVFDVNNVGVKHPQWFMPDEFVNLMNAPPSSLCLRTINPPIVIGPDEPYDAPSYIILTPVMVYDFDIMKSPSTKSLPGFPLDIRFPTLIPLLDGLYYGWKMLQT
ncbi:hypothetical protein OF83DRAFT_1171445 [Amylostereum chailletii]|nr:hypothetical protein OF83DRAFT_1171445 [Amylostereum chailletii]